MPQQENQNIRSAGFSSVEGKKFPSGKSWFFGIGINSYQHFPRLNNARKDVEDLHQLLHQRYQLDEAFTLLDEAATRQTIIDKLYELQGLLGENDKLIIFYSGHGNLDTKGRGYWLPVDAAPRKTSSFIRSSTIRELVEDIGCQHILLISDSCFSGALLARNVDHAQAALEELERDRSRWVISSGRQQEEVADGQPGENSPFASSILKVLRENQQLRLNAGLLFDKVIKLTRFNYKQMPQSAPLFGAGHEGGQYIFHLRANEAADWKACQEMGTLAAYQAFMSKYPESSHTEAAQAALAELREAAAWEAAKAANSILSFYNYNHHYPSGKYHEEALQAIKGLEEDKAWQQTVNARTLSAFLDYKERYPKGRYVSKAEEHIQSFLASEKEPTAWQSAKGKASISAYRAYLEEYPKGRYAIEARTAIRELQQEAEKEARKQQEEQAWREAQASDREGGDQQLNETAGQETYDIPWRWRKRPLIAIGVLLAVALVVWGVFLWSKRVQYGNVILGGQPYRTIELNGLTWMAENLNYEVEGSECYKNTPSNCNQYGRLYDWKAAKKACVTVGWRLPTDKEWREMAKLYGGASVDATDDGELAYGALIRGGKSGFAALLGGKAYDGVFSSLGDRGNYWTATESIPGLAWLYFFKRYPFDHDRGVLVRNTSDTNSRLSCRCVQGNTPISSDEKEQPIFERTEEQKPNSLKISRAFRGDELKITISGGIPPYILQLIREGKEQYRRELSSADSHTILLTKYRKAPGSYELQVEDAYGRQASKTITIGPPKLKTNYDSIQLGGQTYRTIELNGLTWMAENLSYEVESSECYDNKLSNCDQYGRLYDWKAAEKACAAVGWRLPTDKEWREMAELYGGASIDGTDGGKAAYEVLIKGGDSGFAALLSGVFYLSLGENYRLGDYGYYWSATEGDPGYIWYYYFDRSNGELVRDVLDATWKISCRCVQGPPANSID